jgi:hypothetical protein
MIAGENPQCPKRAPPEIRTEDVRERITAADVAKDVVIARGKKYGPPSTNHNNTARLWWAYLVARYGDKDATFELDSEDVCIMNILQKISRNTHELTHDSLIDIHGYLLNLEEIKFKDGTFTSEEYDKTHE